MKLWKRNAIVVIIVLFVGVAVYLNWSYGQTTDVDAEAETTGKLLGEAALVNGVQEGEEGQELDVDSENEYASTGYFASARLNRQQARDSALEILQQAAEDAMADQAMIDEANESIRVMAENTLSEAQIENLVIAKGYKDCVCYINDESVSVVVAAVEGGMTETDTARIAEIVMEETGLSAGQIRIIETAP